MQVKPAQLIGIGLVAVIGAALAVTTLLQEPEQPKHAAVNERGETAALARLSPSPLAPASGAISGAANDPLSAGSTEARDDLYCQGLIFAAHISAIDLADPKERRRGLLSPALASAGADRLIKEGVATRETTAIFARAHTDVAVQDYAKGKPRIPLATCEARAETALAALGK
jgi:hypothetical protein